jgi:acyl-CoA reductase-like NAD-dependent aldehyde dehydrogenase
MTQTDITNHSAVETFTTTDPRDGSFIAEYRIDSKQDVDRAVAHARDAALWWSNLGFSGRARAMKSWRRYLLDRLDELAKVVSAETGKPLADATIEVVLAIDHLHWAAKHARRVLRRRTVASGMLMSNHHATVEYCALGVIGVIGPWNYPVFTPMGSIAYALAAGNTVVFKPSEHTPKVGVWLAESFSEALQAQGESQSPLFVITGGGGTGAALCESDVDKLAFTGSAETGKRVMAACAATLTPVLIEAGGKDAVIVDSDANLAAAADGIVWGSVANAGQTCVGVERVYVVDDVADRLIAFIAERVEKLKVGPELNADIGPVTVPAQVDIIEEHIRAGIGSGGQAVTGSLLSVKRPYVRPVVLVNVAEDSPAITDETFGPVIVINRVRSTDEAISLANNSRYGLGATVFSNSRGRSIAERLHVGMVGVNSIIPYVAIPALPFGGVKESGFGRIHGADGLREFTTPRSVAKKILPPLLRPTSFSRPAWTISALSALARSLYRW